MHSWTFTTRRRWIGMTLRLRWLLSAGRTRVVYRLKRLTSKLGIAPMLRWLIRSLRSEERRVGKVCVRTCRSRWSLEPLYKKTQTYNVSDVDIQENTTIHNK